MMRIAGVVVLHEMKLVSANGRIDKNKSHLRVRIAIVDIDPHIVNLVVSRVLVFA